MLVACGRCALRCFAPSYCHLFVIRRHPSLLLQQCCGAAAEIMYVCASPWRVVFCTAALYVCVHVCMLLGDVHYQVYVQSIAVWICLFYRYLVSILSKCFRVINAKALATWYILSDGKNSRKLSNQW